MTRLKFTETVRRDILRKLRAALSSGGNENLTLRRYTLEAMHPETFLEAREHKAASHFISELEHLASILVRLEEHLGERQPEQRRKEKLDSVANALDALVAAIDKTDDLALGHAMRAGLSHISMQPPKVPSPILRAAKALLCAALRHGSFGTLIKIFSPPSNPFSKTKLGAQNLHLLRARWLARDLQKEYLQLISRFAYEIRNSASSLPPISTDIYSPEFRVAETVVQSLSRLHIEPSTSDTGLAGTAFIATLELAGRPAPRARHWILKAKEARGQPLSQ